MESLGKTKSHQILVGFAAETQNLVAYGQAKVTKKNLDMLVANDVSKSDGGFNVDTNEGYILYPDGGQEVIPHMTKVQMAAHILAALSGIID